MLATSSFARRVAVDRAFSAIRNATFAALLLSLSLFANSAFAQLTGTKNIPGDYATLDAAITDLNLQGVGAPGVTLNLVAANPQTAPLGGYSITTLTGAVGAPIVIQGNGNTITAPTPQASGLLNDAIFKIIGTDYVTLTGFTMLENPANTTTAAGTNNMTEWGVAVLYASTTDGAQNVTIQNNTITLNRTYQNTFGIYSNSTHSNAAVTTSATATGAVGGNNNLRLYSNAISNVNIGMLVVGPTAAADNNVGLDIGGIAAGTGNTITNFGTTGTFSGYANVSGSVNGILVRNSKNINVSYNSITSSSGATGVTVGTLRGIYIVAASSQPIGTFTNNINNNTLAVTSHVLGGTLQGITVETTTSSATSTTNINANNFTALNHTIAAATGAITAISQSGSATAGPLVTSVSSNTFTNLTSSSSGAFTFLSNSFTAPTNGTKNINSNVIVTGFNRTGVSGAVTFFSDNGSDTAGTTNNFNNNNFSNLTLAGTSSVVGISSTNGGAPTKNVIGNTVNGISGATGAIIAIQTGFDAGPTSVSGNTISNLTGGGSVTGLLLASGAGARTVSKNSIHDLSGTAATSVVVGVSVTSTTTSSNITLSNNLIGNLTASTATSSNGVIGLSISGSATTSNFNVFFNTIYISNAASGAGFGSSAISTFASSTATTSVLNLRNNILVNTSVQNGAGLTVAYRRSLGTAGTLANYASTSNNNDFYAGTPGVSNLIYFDGTSSAQTMAAYKAGVFTAGTIAPRDSASISENPTFVSTTGSSPNFLHINTVTATQLESGATPIAGITDDFDGDTRNVSTPDIGADEFNGVLLDLNPPNIVYTALGNTASTTARTLTATITDATGVPTAGAGLPVLYWRINAGSYAPATATSLGSNQYQFTFGAGVTTGDVVSYYVAAQDTAGTPNVGTNPSVGASGFTANPPAASTPPTTPNSYNISIAVTGSLNVGTAEAFTSLSNNSAQGIFKYINDNAVTGNVVINITSDLAIEDGAVALNEFAAPFTVTIKPSGGVRSVTGAAASTAMIRLNGASRVTIDGSTSGGTDRSLYLENTSTTAPIVVSFRSITTTPITGNTIKNATIRNGASTSSAVTVTDTAGLAGYFNNIIIQNNDIQRAFIGVFTNAAVLAGNGSGLLITQNNVDTAGVNANRLVGVYVQGADGATVSNNMIGNFSAVEGENDTGIWLATGAGNTTVSGNTVTNLGMTLTTAFAPYGIRESSGLAVSGNNFDSNTVTNLSTTGSTAVRGMALSSSGVMLQRNKIQGIINNNTGTFGAFGIDVTAGNDAVIKNNFVSDVNHNMTGGAAFGPDFGVVGIRLGAGTGHKVYNNSVNLFGPHTGTATPSLLSAAFSISTTSQTGIDVRNNVFANNITGGTTSIAHVSVFLPSGGTSAMNLTWNNNAYYNGTDPAAQGLAQTGTTPGAGFFFLTSDFNPGATTPATNFRSYTSTLSAAGTNDNSSIAFTTSVPFVSASDLHLQSLSAPESAGTPIAAVTNDIDNDPRPATKPDIGADELVSALTITPTTVAFGNQLINTTSSEMTVTLANTGAGSLDVTTLDAAAAPFARTGTGTCAATLPITIAPSGSCTLTYTFAPTAVGPANQPLTVTSNGPGSGTITLTGTGTQGNLTITPTTVPFGNQLVGSTSAEMTVTLANTGNAPLDVTALTAAAAPFARTGTGTCGPVTITIPASGSCTLTYTFAPSATGAANQVLTVTANAPGSGTITLTGNGTQGNLTITPTSIPFGNVTVNANSGPTAVTLANTGDASLIVTTLSAPSAPFSRIGGNCTAAPITIAAGSSCTVSYQFAPTATGSFSDTVTVTANAPGSGTIGLSGTGVQGNLTISPTSIPFGNQAVSTTSSPTAVTLANTGNASLIVTTLSAPAAPFSRVGGNCSAAPITIAAGSSCTVSYQFAPTATGAFSDTVIVTANAPGSGTIGLSGTGIQGTLTITPNSVNFGTQTLNTTTAESTVTLANTGNASLDVTTLTAAAAPFTRTLTGTCSQTTPITIAASSSCTLTYTFMPTATGPAGQTLTVTSSGAGSGTIALAGTGAGVGGACATGMPIEVSASAGLAGPTGYGTLKAGFDAINAGIHQNNIAVAVCGDTTELATAALNASGVGPSVYTAVLVAPANAGVRTISGTLAAPLVDLNGADNVTIDGLNAGGNALTISNLSNAATAGTSTIRFIGGATNNMLVNTTLLGSSLVPLATAGGTVYFADDVVTTTGNDSNTIATNNIGPAGANLPNKAIFGLGTFTTIGNANSGVVINNNNIYDFFNVGSSVSGIYVANGNDAWTISGNRIYQTAARTFTTTALRYAGITLSQATAPRGSFTVISNVIGFGAADGSGTTTISGSTNTFRGIDAASVDTTAVTSIQNNTISGINQTTTTALTGTSSGFIGMMLGSSGGRFNVGDVTGNKIGSLDGSSTIVVNSTAGTGLVYGMYDFSVNANTVANNAIGSITIQGAGGTNGFRGILLNTGSGLVGTVTGNTVANITNTQVGSYSMYGIQTQLTAATMTDNVVRNFTGNSNGGVVVMAGINVTAGTATNPSLVARNTVHSLRNTVVGGASGAIYAMDFTFPTQANIVERNLVHSISADTTFVGYQVNGILMRGGAAAPSTTTFRNNMVRLGFDAAGAPVTLPLGFTGIRDSAGTNVANNYYHNSVYIGGSGVTGGVALNVGSTAFSSDVVTTTRNFQDNIFWNARSNVATGAALHIAIRVGGTGVNPAGLTSNYNDLYATGNDGVVGVYAGFIDPTLADWQTATGQDASSFASDPMFIAPTGSAVTGDLHISPTIATPIEGTGTLIASVTDDFDGQTRAGLTPVDIGADAGNFVPQIGNLTITPTSVLFGQVAVGATSPEMSVVLANNGTGSLQVTALSAAATPFARTGTGTCSATLPITIAVGGSCTLTYTFSPTTNGPANQTLTVTANAPGSGTIALSGTGIQGNLSITPTNVPFGNQTVGTTSAAMAVNFTNVGNAPLMVTSLTAPAAPFATVPLGALELPAGFINCSAAPFTLAAGATCSIGYAFSPTATGAFTQMLTATTDGLGGGTITLSGTGVQGALTISPTLIAFGDQGVGTTSSTSSVTLSNTGNATLNVTTLTAAAAPFAQVGGSCGSTPIAIAAGANCTVSYTFAPTTIGAANQVLTVTSDAPGSGTITLTGNGVQGTLVVSPTTVDFGSPDVFTTTQFMSVTLSNTGTGSLQVNSLTLAAAPFQRTADGTCGNSLPITIAAGGSCTLTYKFAPTVAGLQSQNFTVSNNGSGGSGMFTLSGTGIDDRIFRDGFDGPAPPEAE